MNRVNPVFVQGIFTAARTYAIVIRGEELRYSAVAGEIVIRREDDETKARIFYVAYNLEGGQREGRPITFAFNGGPGDPNQRTAGYGFHSVNRSSSNPKPSSSDTSR